MAGDGGTACVPDRKPSKREPPHRCGGAGVRHLGLSARSSLPAVALDRSFFSLAPTLAGSWPAALSRTTP